MKIRFTKEVLNAIEPSNQRQRIKDAKVEGLVLEVLPSGRKSFRVYKRVKGQKSPVNVTLGQYPSLTIENARKLALSTLEKIAHGINPNEQAKVEAKAQITLHEVFHDYLLQKELSQSSLRGYNQIFNVSVHSRESLTLTAMAISTDCLRTGVSIVSVLSRRRLWLDAG